MNKTIQPTWYWSWEHHEWHEHLTRTVPVCRDPRLHVVVCYILGLLACQGRPSTVKRCIRSNGSIELWPLREAKWPTSTQKVLVGLLDSWVTLGKGFAFDEILPCLSGMEFRVAMEAICLRYRGTGLAQFAVAGALQ